MRTKGLTIIAVLAMALAACGGGSPSNGASPTEGPGPTAASTPSPDTGNPQHNGGQRPAQKGMPCEEEGVTAEGDIVCTRMQGDGKLIWAAPDGSIHDPSDGPRSLAEILANGPDCADTGVTGYSASFVDTSKVSYIYPLGAMTTSHITPVDHIYVYYPEGAQPAGSIVVSSPAAGKVVAIEDFQKTNGYPYPDHRIVIEHSCNLFSVFIHVGELAPALATAFSSGHLAAPVDVAAGDPIADDSANPNFDFSTFDGTKQLTLANPASYNEAESWKAYTAHPFDYLPADVRAEFERLSLRSSAPFDGRIDWDQPGTLRGNWFVKDTHGYRGVGTQEASYDNHGTVAHGYWDTHLAIAPDAVDNNATILSIGDWGGCPCQFMAKDTSFDPTKVTPSDTPTVLELVPFTEMLPDGTPGDAAHPVKGYTLVPTGPVAGVLALQLHDDGTLTVEKMPGAASAAAFTGFTSAALTYTR